jgi:hypothetical protein
LRIAGQLCLPCLEYFQYTKARRSRCRKIQIMRQM